MKLYRFSPIKSKEELFKAIEHAHFLCHQLCKQTLGEYLPVAGNLGIFSHYPEEYEFLTKLRQEMTDESDNINQKYYRLHKPITIPAKDDVPETTYRYLYIRHPDPYRHHVGDVDFYLPQNEYNKLKQSLLDGQTIKGARIYPRTELDMIELFNPDFDVLAYVVSKKV
jgi:hypothetical protein